MPDLKRLQMTVICCDVIQQGGSHPADKNSDIELNALETLPCVNI